MPRHISVVWLNYLRSTDTCADADSRVLVVRTCYNGECKQIPGFRWSFQPKIAGAHPNLFHIDVCVMNHVIAASATTPLVAFVLRHHVKKVTSSVFNPRCLRRERFLLIWTSELMCCAAWAECIVYTLDLSNCELVRQNTNSTYRSSHSCHCGRVEFGRPASFEIHEAPKVSLS